MNFKYEAIKDIVLKNIEGVGCYSCSIKGVKLALRNKPSEFLKCFYEPSCIFVLEGKKHMLYGNHSLTYTKGQYVVSCADIPVSSKVLEATDEKPFIAIILLLDSTIISNLILETKLPHSTENDKKCLAASDVDENLLDAFYRLAQLIDKPKDDILSSMIIKEIYYRILTGPLGNQLRLIHTRGSSSNQIVQAIEYLKNNFDKKLNIEDIAQSVNMAPSSFYRNFRKVTQVSPLKYQKQLRLYEAQRLMLQGEFNAESASYFVGYESPTQFSREYKKMFGAPPKTDVRKIASI